MPRKQAAHRAAKRNPSCQNLKTLAFAGTMAQRSRTRIERQTMNLTPLRLLLMLDAAVLFLLGALLILAPGRVEQAFHFRDLPPAVGYMIGLWGCVIATLGIGYVVAATNPIRHVVWVQVGIARGSLECVLGVVC